MNYSYVLLSERDGRFYIGSTADLRERWEKHRSGAVRSTAYRRPLRLVYYEGCLSAEDVGPRWALPQAKACLPRQACFVVDRDSC